MSTSTLTILSSDCPGFTRGTKARAVVEAGALRQIAIHRVSGVEVAPERVVVRAGLGYVFTVARAEYNALLTGQR